MYDEAGFPVDAVCPSPDLAPVSSLALVGSVSGSVVGADSGTPVVAADAYALQLIEPKRGKRKAQAKAKTTPKAAASKKAKARPELETSPITRLSCSGPTNEAIPRVELTGIRATDQTPPPPIP